MPYDNVVRALYAYKADDSDELSFEEDELLCIATIGEDSPEWLSGHTLSGDRAGLIPANYVEPVDYFMG